MSNFICSECGKNIIDCGHGNLKTDLELELEKKLDIAVEVLEFYADEDYWIDCRNKYRDEFYKNALFFSNGYEEAQKALAKIKDIKSCHI